MKARKVRQSTLDMVSQHVDVEDIYITRTIEQSDQSLDEIIKKRYPLVLCGGGDGTAMRIIEQMRLKVDRLNAEGGDYQIPKFGLLKLGTGNGWAGQLEVPPKVEPIWSLRQLRTEELRFATFNMIEMNDRLFHFGGVGVDALVLNDYIDLKNKFTEGFMWKLANSLLGYLIAAFGKSVPKVFGGRFRLNVRIVNLSDEPVYKVSHAGGIEELPVKKGEVIFEGPTVIAGVGTTCNYGFNLKVYPFSDAKPGYMHLRMADVTVSTVLTHLPAIWKGTWESPQVSDFLVKHIRVETDEDVPLQLGGDPEGYCRDVEWKVSDFTCDMLDFRTLPEAADEG